MHVAQLSSKTSIVADNDRLQAEYKLCKAPVLACCVRYHPIWTGCVNQSLTPSLSHYGVVFECRVILKVLKSSAEAVNRSQEYKLLTGSEVLGSEEYPQEPGGAAVKRENTAIGEGS